MHKYLNELKENRNKEQNEFKENTNNQLNEINNTMQDMKGEFKEGITILKKIKLKVDEMKCSTSQAENLVGSFSTDWINWNTENWGLKIR
jgi:hypothetical protein